MEPSVTRMDVNWIACCEDGKEPEIIGSGSRVSGLRSGVSGLGVSGSRGLGGVSGLGKGSLSSAL